MKFAVVAALATSAAAGVTVRDAAAIEAILSTIQSATEKVDSAAKAYSGGTPSDVYTAADGLVSAINDGQSKVKASGPLQAADAITLQGPVKDLTGVSDTLVKDLIAKRDQVEAAGQCSQASENVNSVYSAGTELVNVIVSQVQGGKAIQSVAQQLAQPLVDALSSASVAFGSASCVDKAGGSGGSSSAAAGTTSAAAGTTSAAAPSSTEAAATSSTGGYAPPPASTSAAAATTTPSGPVTTPTTAVPAGASFMAPAGLLAMALAVFAL